MNSILELAAEVVAARRETYGPPDEHWQRTADLVNAAFTARVRKRLAAGEPMFAIEDWPIIMSLDKISRELGEAMHRDNPIDIAGYMHGRDEILTRRGRDVLEGLTRVVKALPALRPCPDTEVHIGPHEWFHGEQLCHCLGRSPCASTLAIVGGRTVQCQRAAPHPEFLHEHRDDDGVRTWATGHSL